MPTPELEINQFDLTHQENYYQDRRQEFYPNNYQGVERTRRVPRKELNPVFTQEKFYTGVKVNWENPLTHVIKNLTNNGEKYIPWSQFMETSLFHEDYGYYSHQVELGQDFDTWPNDYRHFGAHVGQSLFDIWSAMDKPSKFEIVEMGAGNGSLAHSLLDWAEKENPSFYEAIKYRIVEQSPKLIREQKINLTNFNFGGLSSENEMGNKVTWTEGSAIDLQKLGIRNVEGAIISNELPDAFSIERVTRLNGRIVQKYVGIENGEWVEVWGTPSPKVSRFIEEHDYIIEEGYEEAINLNAATWQKNTASALKKGALLTIDYGKREQIGEKNRVAIKNFGTINGSPVDYYENMFASYAGLGEVDITADIDFEVLEKIAIRCGLQIAFSGKQSEFLLKNGLYKQLLSLSRNNDVHSQEYRYAYSLAYGAENNIFYASMATRRIDTRHQSNTAHKKKLHTIFEKNQEE